MKVTSRLSSEENNESIQPGSCDRLNQTSAARIKYLENLFPKTSVNFRYQISEFLVSTVLVSAMRRNYITARPIGNAFLQCYRDGNPDTKVSHDPGH